MNDMTSTELCFKKSKILGMEAINIDHEILKVLFVWV